MTAFRYWSNSSQSCKSCPDSTWLGCGSKCYKNMSLGSYGLSAGISQCSNINASLVNAPQNQLQFKCVAWVWTFNNVDAWVKQNRTIITAHY